MRSLLPLGAAAWLLGQPTKGTHYWADSEGLGWYWHLVSNTGQLEAALLDILSQSLSFSLNSTTSLPSFRFLSLPPRSELGTIYWQVKVEDKEDHGNTRSSGSCKPQNIRVGQRWQMAEPRRCVIHLLISSCSSLSFCGPLGRERHRFLGLKLCRKDTGFLLARIWSCSAKIWSPLQRNVVHVSNGDK